MTDIEVPFGDNNKDNAILLLAAADDLGLDQSVVRTKLGAFVVPEEVAEKAFGKAKVAEATEEKAPAKKTTAKKTTAKKTAAAKKK